MKIRLKVNGILIVLALVLITAFPRAFLHYSRPGFSGEAARLFGIALIFLGQLFRTSARGFKSAHSRNGRSLIQSGPYNLVRNPMYLGILLIGLGVVLLLFQWWVIAIFLAVFIARYILLIFKEEKKLAALFPRDYPAYCRRVPRLFPSPAVLLERDVSDYLPLQPEWVKKELGTILGVLFAVLLVESWVGIKCNGIRVYLKESIGMVIVILLFIGLYIYLGRRTAEIQKSNVRGQS